MVSDLDWCVGRKALEDLTKIQDHFGSQLGMTINRSLNTKQDSDEVLQSYDALVHQYAKTPELVTIELTESAYFDSESQQSALIRNIRRRGVSVVIDDFGTDYNSFSYLSDCNFDILKVDKEFVTGLSIGTHRYYIVKMLTKLAHTLVSKGSDRTGFTVLFCFCLKVLLVADSAIVLLLCSPTHDNDDSCSDDSATFIPSCSYAFRCPISINSYFGERGYLSWQRGRIHKVLPVVALLWLAVASLKIEAIMLVFAILYFYSQVQTKKTRVQGPLWVIYLANGLAFAYVGIVISEQPSIVGSALKVIEIFLLGALFSHLLLTIAKTRLQAFHRILPVTGIVSAMLLSIVVLVKSAQIEPNLLAEHTNMLLSGFALMITAVLIWCWHILLSKTVHKIQLWVAFTTMLVSMSFIENFIVL